MARIGRILAATFIAIVISATLQSENVAAHTAFDRSDPAPNSILPESPQLIQVWFTEPLEYDYSTLSIFDERGVPVPGATSDRGSDATAMILRLREHLARGTYSVAWATLSAADSHTSQGYFAFTVGSASDVTTVAAPAGTIEDEGAPLWLQTLSRWFVLLSLAPVIAVWLIWLVVFRPTIQDDTSARLLADRVWSIAVAALVAALLTNVVALVVQATLLDGASLPDRTVDLLLETRYGKLWIARVALLAATGVVLEWVDWVSPVRRRFLALLGLLFTLSLAIPISLNAHASAIEPGRTTAIVFDWVHATAASVWLGGLLYLLVVLAHSSHSLRDRREILVRALPRFSATAIVCWGLLVLTGAYSSWLQVGRLDALRSTDFGKSLMAKLVLVAIVLVIAALNLLVITRRWINDPAQATAKALSGTIAAELLLGIAILLIVGRMTSLPPAHHANADPVSESIEVSLDLEGHPATLSIVPGIPGPNHFVMVVEGETLPDGTEAAIDLVLSGGALGTTQVQLERTVGNQFEWHGSELSVAGEWSADVVVRSNGDFSWEGNTTLTVASGGESDNSNPWQLTTHSIAGLLLVAIGLIGLVIGWQAGSPGLRRESALLGAVALVLGLGIIATDRVAPPGTEIPPRLAATDDSIIQGAKVYEARCLACHGARGEGDGPDGAGLRPPPADFTDIQTHTHDDTGWYTAVATGVPGTGMPAFGEELSDDDIWHVINFIQSEFQ